MTRLKSVAFCLAFVKLGEYSEFKPAKNYHLMPQTPPDHPLHQQAGFNLLELLVVLAIAGVMFGIAIPAGQGMLDRSRLIGATNEVYSAMLFTRSEAVRLRKGFRICFVSSQTANACSNNTTSHLGAFSVQNSNIDKLVRTFDINPNVTVSLHGAATSLDFERLGNLAAKDGEVYFRLEAGDYVRKVEACFNGRIGTRKEEDDSLC